MLKQFLKYFVLAISIVFSPGIAGHASPISEADNHMQGRVSEGKGFNNTSNTLDDNCPQIWGSQIDTNKFDPTIQVYSSGTHFQWQVSSDKGASWSDIHDNDTYSGTTSRVLKFDNIEQPMKDHIYRLKISDSACSIFSDPFSFPLAQITLHPTDQCVEPFDEAVFNATATGEGLTYRWQANYGSHWFDIYDNTMYSGTATDQLQVKADPYWMNGHRFRVDVTVKDGFTLSSGEATLYIGEDNCLQKPVNKWTGARDRQWNNTANWSLDVLPTLESDALIPAGLERYPLIEKGAIAKTKNLTLESGSVVEINQHWLQISANIIGEGSIRAAEGKMALVGSQAQHVPQDVLENNRLGDLLIQNSAGVTLEGPLDISRSVVLEEGILHSNGHLRLLSDATGTALIDGAGTGSISGQVKMQRYLETAFGYKYFSTPFRNSKVGDFAEYVDLNSPFPSFYRYQQDHKDSQGNDISGWVEHTASDYPLIPMYGYALNFGNSNSPLTLDLKGEINQESYNLQLKNNSGEFTQGFHLVGNPYPSPIDWDAPGWTKKNIDNGIYFFTASEDSQYTGTYTSYVSGVSSDGSQSASSIIPSMQGFFVHVSEPLKAGEIVEGELGMTDAVRVNNFKQSLFRAAFSTTPSRTLLRLAAKFDAGTVADHMVVYVNQHASDSYNGTVDALKLINTDPRIPNLYSLTPRGKKLSINALAEMDAEEIRVPLGIKAETSGSLTINLQDMENFPAGVNVYLIDLNQKRITNLINNSYSFVVNSGVHDNRLELMLSRSTQALEARAFKEPFSAHPSRGALRIILNPGNQGKGLLSVYSISGHLIDSRQTSGQRSVYFQIPNTGVYVVVLEYGKGRFTKKILVN